MWDVTKIVCHFSFFIAFLNSLRQEEYVALKKEKSKLRITFFVLVWLFQDFFKMSTKLQVAVMVTCDVLFEHIISNCTSN